LLGPDQPQNQIASLDLLRPKVIHAVMDKAPDAYRTISEVGEDLDIAQHVLRFWETRFPQIKPLKRGGGRRYYRPDDVDLLKGIRHLLYSEGYTIKGVQRILREQGVKDVMAVGRSGSLAVLAPQAEAPPWTPGLPDLEAVEEPASIAMLQRPSAPAPILPLQTASAGPVPPMEPTLRRPAEGAQRTVQPAPRKQTVAESAMPLLDAMMPPEQPLVAVTAPAEPPHQPPTHAQVSMFRGGLQRAQEMPAPVITEAPILAPDDGASERKARLRHALAELEACRAIIAEHQRRAS
jgi:DNA-binding transcriptional MerR regulator